MVHGGTKVVVDKFNGELPNTVLLELTEINVIVGQRPIIKKNPILVG
jgi:hypothetical protein